MRELSDNLTDLIERVRNHKMTEAEIDAQRRSWVRGMTTGCEHGVLDFETCPACMEGRSNG